MCSCVCFLTHSSLCWRPGWCQAPSGRRSARTPIAQWSHMYCRGGTECGDTEMRPLKGTGSCNRIIIWFPYFMPKSTAKIENDHMRDRQTCTGSVELPNKKLIEGRMSGTGKKKEWGGEEWRERLKETLSLLRLQNTDPFLVRRKQRDWRRQEDDRRDKRTGY